jgi:pyruvate dehydrogenase E2 component (dihydrolipoamide acetyltransferase)
MTTAAVQEVLVPDIGDFDEVPVIEIHVSPGDVIAEEDPIITLESDKATMDVPAPARGVVQEVKVSEGDMVSEGSLILTLAPAEADQEALDASLAAPATQEAAGSGDSAPQRSEAAPSATAPSGPGGADAALAAPAAQEAAGVRGSTPPPPSAGDGTGGIPYASPGVRRLARELGVDLSRVNGSGRKERILPEDVRSFAEGGQAPAAPAAAPSAKAPAGAPAGDGFSVLPWPKVDFSKFGPVDVQPLSRIQKLSGPYLHRNWVMIPHVTHNDEADITDLEAFRKQMNEAYSKQGVKFTMLAFVLKALVAALKEYPKLNSSLEGENLILKRYYHLGFAADTPQGLVVPVIKDVDQKGVVQIAGEMRDLSAAAREGSLKSADMSGGTFTVSSLGGIGGTSFTPIVNAPEVAILGMTRSATKPVWQGGEFKPRLMQPLSLSYDHRVIDGAEAARFTAYLAQTLTDMRRVLL